MANVYVDSNAVGAGTGADWANAFTTLAAGVGAAGDTTWVAHNHAETAGAAKTITFPGTITTPNFCYCVNSAGTVPPVSADLRTTATVTTTGAFSLTVGGSAYVYGITFTSGSGAVAQSTVISNGNPGVMRFEQCAFRLGGTSGGTINVSRSNNKVYWKNCSIQVASTASLFVNGGELFWDNDQTFGAAVTGATLPTSPMGTGSGGWLTVLRGLDLSAFGAGKTLVNTLSNTGYIIQVVDCKLAASVTLCNTPAIPAGLIDFVRCDSGATNYFDFRYRYEGTQTVETTIIRTGGATDGTTPIAWKLVTTANSKWVLPFESQPITIWNDSTSAITTLTFYGTTTGGGVPNNDDIWIEAEYLGSASTPVGSFITTTKADNLAASGTTNNSSDASTWGGGGAGNGFKIVVPSFTPGLKGPINLVIKAAKASSTYYLDPRPEISGISVQRSYVAAPGVYANERFGGLPASRAILGM